MLSKKNLFKDEAGFTLIEIIAVIIILGIMAAVAIPKFFDMQEDAKQAVLNGALAEGASRFNHAYAKYILNKKVAPPNVAALSSSNDYLGENAGAAPGENLGDFNLIWTDAVVGGENVVQIYVQSCKTISDMTGLDAYRTKTITGIKWGPASGS
jgi:prepilin-type N-terminal cleavage/methylation domain-containing protein